MGPRLVAIRKECTTASPMLDAHYTPRPTYHRTNKASYEMTSDQLDKKMDRVSADDFSQLLSWLAILK